MNKLRMFARMRTLFSVAIWVLCVGFVAACAGPKENLNAGETPAAEEEHASSGRAKALVPCDTDADCGDDLICFSLLGTKICTVTGCADGTACPDGGQCVVSDAIAADGVCAGIASDDFCGRNCRDILACNLNPECAENGCCSDLSEDGCPVTCDDLDQMDCEISPQCPAECCTP